MPGFLSQSANLPQVWFSEASIPGTRRYDGNGNLPRRTTLVNGAPAGAYIQSTWDQRNQLTKIEFYNAPVNGVWPLNKTVGYSYDGPSNRISKTLAVPGQTSVVENYVYDATSGRFLGEDPLRFGAGDTNLTRYSANDPVNFSDPSCLLYGDIGEFFHDIGDDVSSAARDAGHFFEKKTIRGNKNQ